MLTGGAAWRRYCNKESLRRLKYDWLEFQADSSGGALLMPVQLVVAHIGPRPELNSAERHSIDSSAGRRLIVSIAEQFRTSVDAARVRLVNLGYLFRPRRVPQLDLPFTIDTSVELPASEHRPA